MNRIFKRTPEQARSFVVKKHNIKAIRVDYIKAFSDYFKNNEYD